MERIRYRRREDGSLVSVKTFKHPSNGSEYLVEIRNLTVLLRDPNTGLVVDQIDNQSLQMQKKLGRKLLEKVGISMEMGRRVRKEKTE